MLWAHVTLSTSLSEVNMNGNARKKIAWNDAHENSARKKLTFSKHHYFNIAQHFQYHNGEKKGIMNTCNLISQGKKMCVCLSTRIRAARSLFSNEVFVIVNWKSSYQMVIWCTAHTSPQFIHPSHILMENIKFWFACRWIWFNRDDLPSNFSSWKSIQSTFLPMTSFQMFQQR